MDERHTVPVPLDRGILQEVSDGDSAFEAELMEDFRAGARDIRAALQKALSARDLSALKREAHTLKGSSRSLGAAPLGAACEALEHAARDGETGALELLYRDVEERLQELLSFMEAHWNIS